MAKRVLVDPDDPRLLGFSKVGLLLHYVLKDLELELYSVRIHTVILYLMLQNNYVFLLREARLAKCLVLTIPSPT